MSTFTLGLVIANLKQLGNSTQVKDDSGNDIGKLTYSVVYSASQQKQWITSVSFIVTLKADEQNVTRN